MQRLSEFLAYWEVAIDECQMLLKNIKILQDYTQEGLYVRYQLIQGGVFRPCAKSVCTATLEEAATYPAAPAKQRDAVQGEAAEDVIFSRVLQAALCFQPCEDGIGMSG